VVRINEKEEMLWADQLECDRGFDDAAEKQRDYEKDEVSKETMVCKVKETIEGSCRNT